MCGRYTWKTPVNVLAEQFQIDEYPSSMNASYNIAPTQEVAAVIEGEGKRKLEMLHWGLIPSWADDPQVGNKIDRKSTRLNSSHANISYAVFCLKKKK